MFNRLILVVQLLTFSSVSIGAVLDFEEFNPPANGVLTFFDPIQSNGFQISPISVVPMPGDLLNIADNGHVNIPNSGSNTLVAGSHGYLTITELNGNSFNLGSFFAAEGSNVNSGFFQFSATGIQLFGVRSDGTTQSQIFNFDLIADESPDDFELISPVGFNNLISLSLTGLGGTGGFKFAIDDINLTALAPIPVPAAFWLFSSALIGFVGYSRRRKIS